VVGIRDREGGVSIRSLSIPGATALVAVVPAVTLSSYRLGILALVAAYSVASVAQNLLAGYADVPSLGNVAFFGTSAFLTASLIVEGHVASGVAIVAGILAAGLLGLAVGFPSLRISGMHLAIVTVALVFVTQEVMTQQNAVHGVNALTVTQPRLLLDDRRLYVAAVIVAGLIYWGIWNILRSRSGRAILAGMENRHAALAMGVNVNAYRLLAFVLSGALSGVAGIVYLYYLQTVTPSAFPLDLSVAFLTMVIVGGARSLAGSLLGAILIGLFPQLLQLLPSTIGSINVQQNVSAIYAVILLLALRFFPDGIWPSLVALFSRLRAPAATLPLDSAGR
jgi:branched-chain amino acid transport system permease protein